MNVTYIRSSLPNGGRIFYVKNKLNRANYITLIFPSGARCETIPGLAHFVEHMFFTGTKQHTKEELQEIENTLGVTNALTNNNSIKFTATLLKENIEKYLSIVEEEIDNSLITPQLVEKEKDVILQEISTRADDKYLNLYITNCYNLFEREEYKNDLTGNKESVKSIQPKDVKKFIRKYFVANNLDVLVITSLSLRKIKKMIVKNLESRLPVAKKFTKLEQDYLEVKNDKFYCVKTEKIGKCYININFVIDKSKYDDEFFAKFNLFHKYLVRYGKHSLYEELRSKKHLIYSFRLFMDVFKNQSVLTFETECEKGKINQIIEVLSKYLKDLCTNGVYDEVVEKIKRENKLNDARSIPSIRGLENRLYELKNYGYIKNKKKMRKIFDSTNSNDLNKIAKEIFSNPRVSATIYGDVTKKEIMTAKQFYNLFKSYQSSYSYNS